MIIFKQLSVLPFLQEGFTACFGCFQFRKIESTCLAKMNKKTTTRIRDFRSETYILANIISEDGKKRKQLVGLK